MATPGSWHLPEETASQRIARLTLENAELRQQCDELSAMIEPMIRILSEIRDYMADNPSLTEADFINEIDVLL